MKVKRSKAYFEVLFIVGLCLAILEKINLRQPLLPNFASGFLAGLSITLIVGAQILKRKVNDGT